jgi:hypothetical protein
VRWLPEVVGAGLATADQREHHRLGDAVACARSSVCDDAVSKERAVRSQHAVEGQVGVSFLVLPKHYGRYMTSGAPVRPGDP